MMKHVDLAKKKICDAIDAHVAHGFGEIHIVIAPDAIDVLEGTRTRITKSLDKFRRTA